MEQTALTIQNTEDEFRSDFSSMSQLIRVTPWILRFTHNTRLKQKILDQNLTFKEIEQTRHRVYLLSRAQDTQKEAGVAAVESSLTSSSSFGPRWIDESWRTSGKYPLGLHSQAPTDFIETLSCYRVATRRDPHTEQACRTIHHDGNHRTNISHPWSQEDG